MTTEWKELVTMREVAEAQHNKWEIKRYEQATVEWVDWDGIWWDKRFKYRGRPKRPNPVPQDAGGIVRFSNCKDGLWAHFDLEDGSYKYTINLDADHISSKFADAYRKKFAEPAQPKTKTVKMLCWYNGCELVWQNEQQGYTDKWQRIPSEDITCQIKI